MSWGKRRRKAPKTPVERDWQRSACVNRVKKLMELRTQVFSPFPYTVADMATYLYPPEVSSAISILNAVQPAAGMGMLYVSTTPDLIIGDPGCRLGRVPLVFPTEPGAVVDRYGQVYSLWCPPHVQEVLGAWVVQRRSWQSQEHKVGTIATELFNAVGTYAQACRLWPALQTFMTPDMKQKVASQRTTRVGAELRHKWEMLLIRENVTASNMETWLTEALLLEGSDVPTVYCHP